MTQAQGMTARYWSFYRMTDGTFTGAGFGGTHDAVEEDMQRNIPAGCGAIEGRYNRGAQAVQQTENGPVVIDYQPPAPAADAMTAWAWDSVAKTWQPVPTFAANQAATLAQIDAQLAALDQEVIRPAGEIAEATALDQTPPGAAVTKLQSINAAKQALRNTRAQLAEATTQAQLDAIKRAL